MKKINYRNPKVAGYLVVGGIFLILGVGKFTLLLLGY